MTWQTTTDRNQSWPSLALLAWLILLSTDTAGRSQDTAGPDPEKPTVRLVEDPKPDRLLDVTAHLDVRGRILAPVGVDRVVPLPLQASARLSWQTRRLPADGDFHRSLRTLRSFASAVSKVRVDRRTTESSLRTSRPTIVTEGTPSGLRHYSLEGPLTGDELELLELPADPLALIGTLPLGQVPHDHAWTPGRWTLPLITGLNAVTRGSLKGRIVKVTATTANVLLEGSAEGAAGGARSQVTFSGSLVFDHQRGFLKQASITIEEHRQAGPISPGLEVVAQVRIERKPATAAAGIGVDRTAEIPTWPTIPAGLASHRHWHRPRAADALVLLSLHTPLRPATLTGLRRRKRPVEDLGTSGPRHRLEARDLHRQAAYGRSVNRARTTIRLQRLPIRSGAPILSGLSGLLG